MKALITIIVLALVAWGAWYFIWGNDGVDSAGNPATVNEALDYGSDASLDGEVEGDVDLGEFQDKG